VQVDEPIHHFGTMLVGETGTHVFVVRNVGDAPLELGEPETTCKCTFSTLDTRTVAPGGSVEIKLEWESNKVGDPFRQGAEIPTNDPDHPHLALVLEGRVEPLLVVSPGFEWHLGEFTGDEPRTVTGALYSKVLDSFSILKIECAHPKFSTLTRPLDAERLKELQGKCGYAVDVTIDPSLPEGPVAAELLVKTDVEKAGDVQVNVTALRLGPIRLLAAPGVRWNGDDRAVDLGRFPAANGASATLFMFVIEPAGQRFEITSVEVDPAHFKADVTEDPSYRVPGRRRYEVKLAVPPNQPPDVRLQENSAKVRLHTNHPSAPLVKLYAEYRSYAESP
jgi:hypothetical protein